MKIPPAAAVVAEYKSRAGQRNQPEIRKFREALDQAVEDGSAEFVVTYPGGMFTRQDEPEIVTMIREAGYDIRVYLSDPDPRYRCRWYTVTINLRRCHDPLID